MIVYRVENKYKQGPYRGYYKEYIPELGTHTTQTGHPCPTNDGIKDEDFGPNNPYYEYVFGFINKNRLHKWFSGIQHKLRKNGYHIAVYDVPQEYVYRGNIQLVFKQSTARLTRTLKLSHKRR